MIQCGLVTHCEKTGSDENSGTKRQERDKQAHEAIYESEYHSHADKNVINADKAKGKPNSKVSLGR